MIGKWGINDDLGWIYDIWSLPTMSSNTTRLRVYDPEKYDLTPKESYKKELAEAKKKEIESLEKEKENLDKRIKELKSS